MASIAPGRNSNTAPSDSFLKSRSIASDSKTSEDGGYPSQSLSSSGPTKSFLNLTSSTLASVFGSNVSLTELSGDSQLSPEQDAVLSTLSEHHKGHYPSPSLGRRASISSSASVSPSTQLGEDYSFEDVADPDGATGKGEEDDHYSSNLPLFTKLVILFISGVTLGKFFATITSSHIHFATPFITGNDRKLTHVDFLWGGMSVIIGLVSSFLDKKFPTSSTRTFEFSLIIRLFIAFLGITFGLKRFTLAEPIKVAIGSFSIIFPIWFVIDKTALGFFTSFLVTALGLITVITFNPESLPPIAANDQFISSIIYVFSVFFTSCVCMGNLGRLFLAGPKSQNKKFQKK